MKIKWCRSFEAGLVVSILAVATGCSSNGVGEAKPCKPGCVDEKTRLECDSGGAPHEVACTQPDQPCAESVCNAGTCETRAAQGASCGGGEGTCNAAYACLGPNVQLTAIRQHTCLTDAEGRLWCWGGNGRGELGDGTQQDRGTPVPVRGLSGKVRSATAGYAHTCALMTTGEAYCWGDNTGGQVSADSATNPVLEPMLVPSPVAFTSIIAGQGQTCGITGDEEVYCWGNTSAGQCGVDPSQAFEVGPTKIPGLDHVKSVQTVKNHVCAVRSEDPTMVCWGSNLYLEDGGYVVHKLGPGAGDQSYSATPLPVDVGVPVVAIGMGYESTYAVGADGSAYAWGYNGAGQLGIDATDKVIASPTRVMASPGVPFSGVIDMSRSDGSDMCAEVQGVPSPSYLCWGKDDHGELALNLDGFVRFQYPQPTVVLPAGATGLVRGEDHGCVVVTDTTTQIWCYGKEQWVANGSVDPQQDQKTPAPITWDTTAGPPP
ncbi:MAG TPA: hypothetical protein VHE30_22690 [Polyangiaceae bacterium]|nr:hypothetical protein [Polyangiaceae bacterium]